MEEFYDYSGEGHIGAKTDGESLSLGASGTGRRISKRIYRFRGNTELTVKVIGDDPADHSAGPAVNNEASR